MSNEHIALMAEVMLRVAQEDEIPHMIRDPESYREQIANTALEMFPGEYPDVEAGKAVL